MITFHQLYIFFILIGWCRREQIFHRSVIHCSSCRSLKRSYNILFRCSCTEETADIFFCFDEHLSACHIIHISIVPFHYNGRKYTSVSGTRRSNPLRIRYVDSVHYTGTGPKDSQSQPKRHHQKLAKSRKYSFMIECIWCLRFC